MYSRHAWRGINTWTRKAAILSWKSRQASILRVCIQIALRTHSHDRNRPPWYERMKFLGRDKASLLEKKFRREIAERVGCVPLARRSVGNPSGFQRRLARPATDRTRILASRCSVMQW